MACNPPYKRGLIGQWDKCRFPGVLRQDCYEYINFDYDCSGNPCPDRVVVIEVCDANAAHDDNIKITLNGTVIADVLDFSADERNGYFLIAHPSATLDVENSSLTGENLGAHPEKCLYVSGSSTCWCHAKGDSSSPPNIIRFDPKLILRGANTIGTSLVKAGNNGNYGHFNVRTYLNRDGKLVCGCDATVITYGNPPQTLDFPFDNCCGAGEAPSCPTPTATPLPTATPAPDSGSGCNCCVYAASGSCIHATSESDCYARGGSFYQPFGNGTCPSIKPVGKCCGPETITCIGRTGPKCRLGSKAECDAVGGIFSGYGTDCPGSDEKCGYPCRTSFFIDSSYTNSDPDYSSYDEIDFMQRYPPELYGFGFNDCSYEYPSLYQPQALIQPEPEPVFSTQATSSCNITAQLRTTGCCLELEESTGRMYAVGAGTVSVRVTSAINSKCSCLDFKLNINGKRWNNTVRDGEPINIEVDSSCKCAKRKPWRTPGGFKPSPCNKGPAPTPGPLRILKNTETGVYQIQLNLNTSSSQNDCGCG
jgi:hypothetical protein